MENSTDSPNAKVIDTQQTNESKEDTKKESKPDETTKEEEKILTSKTETKEEISNVVEEEKKKENSNNHFINTIKNSINNIISLSSKKEEKNEKPKENNSSKESINNTDSNSNIKEDENGKEKEKEKVSTKENNVNDYVFPIPNNSNPKLEESKNSEPISSNKISQNNFRSLNLKIPENLIPKTKDFQSQNQTQYHQSFFNMTYFTQITFSCSLNTHSVKKSKSKPIQKEQEFFEKIIKIADVSNIGEFWEVFQHLKKPSQCPVGSDYHIFKKGIFPMWEDKLNMDGGKLSVLLTNKYANVIWEEVTFNFSKGLLPYYDYINGIVISMRPKFVVLSFWIKCGNNTMVEKIRTALSGLLQTPSSNCIDFIPFH